MSQLSAQGPSEDSAQTHEKIWSASLATANYTRVIALSVLLSLWTGLIALLVLWAAATSSGYRNNHTGIIVVLVLLGLVGVIIFIVQILKSFQEGSASQRRAR